MEAAIVGAKMGWKMATATARPHLPRGTERDVHLADLELSPDFAHRGKRATDSWGPYPECLSALEDSR